MRCGRNNSAGETFLSPFREIPLFEDPTCAVYFQIAIRTSSPVVLMRPGLFLFPNRLFLTCLWDCRSPKLPCANCRALGIFRIP